MRKWLMVMGLVLAVTPAGATTQSMPKCTAWVSDFLPGAVNQLRRIIQEECGNDYQSCEDAALSCEAAAVTCEQTCGDVNIPPLDELCGPVTVEEGIAAIQSGYARCRVRQGRNRLRVLCADQQ